MILTDFQIKAEIERGTLKISPFDESLINPSSLDVRLGKKFSQVQPRYINIQPTQPGTFITEEVGEDRFILQPGDMVLSTLAEHIGLPSDISATLKGKSSLARLGIDNSSYGAWIDPGWEGDLVIEVANHGKHPIVLDSGMKIGQLIFYKHCPAQVPYNEKSTSRYMNQSGVQGSRGVD